MSQWRLIIASLLAAVCICIIALFAHAQQPPGTGGYTFQGQGNIAQVFAALANPQLGQVPFGNKLGGYSLINPSGDISSTGTLGQFNVTGLHLGSQTCSTSPCPITSAIVNCNASSGPITLQAPGAGGTGLTLAIQKVDLTSNACNFTGAGSDTINGLPQIAISTPFLPMLAIDSQPGLWFAGLLQLATGATGGTGFPLQGNADFNNWSGINIGGLQLVQQSAPSNLTATATCSGTCATTFTYEVSCLTAFGESAQINNAPNTTTAVNASTLSASNFNVLNWTFQPQCRNGYNIYGRVSGSLGLLTTLPQTTTTFTDNGSILNPANSYTFSFASAAYPAVTIWDLQGAATVTPVDVQASNSGSGVKGSTILTAPTITTTQNHDMQVATYAWDKSAGTWSGPAGFTTTVSVAANPVTNYGLGLAEKDQATAGAIAASNSTTSLSNSWAALNLAIKSSNTGSAITLGSHPTYTAAAPYSSVTFGDPSGTSTGDLELVCVSFLSGTSIQVPTAPANFQLIASVISGTGKVQLNCYTNAPTVGGNAPPPTSNTTGALLQIGTNGITNNLSVQEGHLGNAGAYGNSTNFPTNNLVVQTTATKAGHFAWLTSTNQSLNGGSCTTAPTFNVFDGSSNTGTAKTASTSVQNSKGTATTQSQSLTFQAGDIIGIYVSTQGATCTAPTFAVDATLNFP